MQSNLLASLNCWWNCFRFRNAIQLSIGIIVEEWYYWSRQLSIFVPCHREKVSKHFFFLFFISFFCSASSYFLVSADYWRFWAERGVWAFEFTFVVNVSECSTDLNYQASFLFHFQNENHIFYQTKFILFSPRFSRSDCVLF